MAHSATATVMRQDDERLSAREDVARPAREAAWEELTGLSAGGLVVDGYLIPEDVSLTFRNGKRESG